MAAQEIGSLFVSLVLETATFSSELKKTTGELKEVGTKIEGSLSSIVTGMKALAGSAAALGLKEANDKLNEWANGMAEAGEKAVNLGRALGIPLEKIVQLQSVFTLAGASAESASAALLHMDKSISDATQNAGPMRDNFAAIGISLQDLKTKGQDPVAMLDLLAERFVQYAASTDKATVFSKIFGKSIEEITPILGGGAERLAELRERAEAFNPAAQAAATAGEALAEKLNETKLAVTGLSNEGFVILNPLLIDSANNMTDFVVSVRNAIVNVNALLGPIGGLVRLLKALPIGPGGFNFPGFGIFNTAKELAKEFNKPAASVTLPPVIVRPPGTAKVTAPKTGGGGGGGGGPDQVSQWRDELDQMLIAQRKFFDDSKKDELKFWQDKLALTAEGSKEYIKVRKMIFDLEKQLAKQAEEDGIRRAQADMTITDEQFKRKEQAIKHLVDIDQMTKTEGIAAEKDLSEQKWALDQQYYARKRAAAEGDTRTLATLNDKYKEDYERHLTELEKLDQDKEKTRFDNLKKAGLEVAGVFERAFGSAFDAISNHTFKLRDAIGSLLKDLAKTVASSAFKRLIGGDSGEGGGILGTLLGKVFGFGGASKAAAGAGSGPFGDNWSAAELGMATGGSFMVGGSGAIDSKVVAFRATPGELVDVTPPNQRGGGGAEIIRIDLNPSEGWVAGVADQRIVTRSGQIIDVAVRQSQRTVQRNFAGMSAEAQARTA